jgi:LPXTG-motif cell wall-anchored protein
VASGDSSLGSLDLPGTDLGSGDTSIDTSGGSDPSIGDAPVDPTGSGDSSILTSVENVAGTELPRTGLPVWAAVLIGLALLATGLALRRRRRMDVLEVA